MTSARPASKSNPFKPSLSWLLIFVPAVIALELTHSKSHGAIFVCSCLAILPLAGWLGKATEHLAEAGVEVRCDRFPLVHAWFNITASRSSRAAHAVLAEGLARRFAD